MKILVDGGNSGSGGYFRYLSGLFGSGVFDEDQVWIVCSPPVAALLGPVDTGVEVLMEPALDSPRRRSRLKWWRREWSVLVATLKPDAVLHPAGILRGNSLGVPRIAIHHSMAPFVWSTYRQYGASPLGRELLVSWLRLRRSFRAAQGVIFHSAYTQRSVTRQVGGIKLAARVPNAVSTGFSPGPAPRRNLGAGPVHILCVSSIHMFKHQWNVVAAVASQRRSSGLDLRLDFVGGGEPLAIRRLQRSIRNHDAAGWATLHELPAGRVAEAYRSCDIFVFPSSVETWPITLLEAMASGVPIASSDRMSMPEMLRDAGVYFDPESVRSIATAIEQLLTDADLRERCAALAPQYAVPFTWARSASLVRNFVLRVLERGRT